MSDTNILLDPNQWNYRDFLKFSKALSTGNLIEAYRLAQQVIVEWEYPVSLEDRNALAKLSLSDGAKVMQTINDAFTALLDSSSLEDVKVDFAKAGWNTLKMMEFYDATAKFDYPVIEKMVFEVATMEGVSRGTLPLVEGSKMVRAIQDKHRKLMSGKA
jgi:hypothetical protein